MRSEELRLPLRVQWLTRDKLLAAARSEILSTDTVLDIGCGLRPQTFFRPKVHLCCDAHHEYCESLRQWPELTVFQARADQLLPLLPDRSVDSVFLLDVIEHLEKEAGELLLRECERVSRRQVIVFTPLGFVEQNYADQQMPDAWGLHGGYWQTHRSGWLPEDFDNSWRILACRDFHRTDNHGVRTEEPFGAFWAIKTLENALPKFPSPRPNIAGGPAVILPYLLATGAFGHRIQATLADKSFGSCLISSYDGDVYDVVAQYGRIGNSSSYHPIDFIAPRDTPYCSWDWLGRLGGSLRYLQSVNRLSQALMARLRETRCTKIVIVAGDLIQFPAAFKAAAKLGLEITTVADAAFQRELEVRAGMRTARWLHSRAFRRAHHNLRLKSTKPLADLQDAVELTLHAQGVVDSIVRD